MKYIFKTGIKDSSNHENICWLAAEGSFNVLTGKAKLKMVGWKDVEAFQSKAAPADSKWVELELSSLKTFEAVWGEIAMRLVGEGVFLNGEIKETV